MARISKLNAWFKAFTDETNPDTFMNRTGSAKAAKYKAKSYDSFASIGLQNFKKLQNRIEEWMDEVGMSDNRLKTKVLALMQAKRTKFFAHQGSIMEERTVEALEIQRKTLDMALKVKGLYAPEKRELSGKDGKPLTITTLVPEPDPPIDEPDSNKTDG